MRLQSALLPVLLLLLLPALEPNYYTAAHPWQRHRPGISRFSSVKIAFKVCHRTEARTTTPGPQTAEACPAKLRPIVERSEKLRSTPSPRIVLI
uniref:Putative secreted protein n=1 Tax=Anopheles darlingi TaxID=43151 RepID=A0A2M4DLQ9_ANODA